MQINARTYYWSNKGMTIQSMTFRPVGYIQRGDVERLLSDAYHQGVKDGLEKVKQIVQDVR